MRPKRPSKQGTVAHPPTLEEACPSAKDPASVVGPIVSEAACPTLTEPDRTAQPRLSVPNRQHLLSAMTIDELVEADHPVRAIAAGKVRLAVEFLGVVEKALVGGRAH